jgi:ATP-dependent Clp protease, protease subunit
MAASMGAFLLGAGAPGKRKSLPNSRIMIHQPLGGAQGQAADIEIQAKEILFIKSLLNKYMADYTDQPIDKVSASTLYPLLQHTSADTLSYKSR